MRVVHFLGVQTGLGITGVAKEVEFSLLSLSLEAVRKSLGLNPDDFRLDFLNPYRRLFWLFYFLPVE